jgi:hypothetical protein
MDRTSAITRLNTEEIATEVNNVIKKGLDKLLGDHLYRYELLEKTHDAIMNLPSVRNHLNQDPLPPQQCENNNNNVKYEQMIEKLLKRIDELTFEVNQLKQTCKKEYTDIKVEDELKVVKLEQKENIRLEIEEEADDDASSCEAEEDNESESETEDEEDDDVSEVGDEVASAIEAEEENICSECDCKVILDEDIVVVDGKKYCGACDPTSSKEEEADVSEAEEEPVASLEEEEVASLEEEDVASLEEEVETEKSESVTSAEEEEEVVEEEVVEEAEEEEFIEIDIDDVTYCTNNEENGFIYELTEDGDVGEKIGYLKDGEPFFYADEK